MPNGPEERGNGGAAWIVLTPSIDDRAWRKEIRRAAEEIGLSVVDAAAAPEGALADDRVILITNDAHRALASGAAPDRIAVLIPEPGTSYDVLEDDFDIISPHSVWDASMLLARALSLAPRHRVVTSNELATKPTSITILDQLLLKPPPSGVEIPRRPAVNAAFDIYRSLISPDADPVEWSNRLFIYDERATREAADWGVLDITGRPRLLVYGPYLALPPGWWRARICFGVDRDAASHQYRVDWGTRTACVSEYVTPGAPGIYQIDLDFEWRDSDASEIRLILTEGSFMGTVLFQGIVVRRIPGPAERQGVAGA